jgi:DNA-binding transcriptional ArsR family regulator
MAKKTAQEVTRPGQFAYEGLDRVMHEKARLGILTSLVTHPEGLLFNDLKELCSLTDGNLNRHLKTLQEARMVEVWKRFKDNHPQTLCRITPSGKRRFVEYLDVLEDVVTAARAREAQAAVAETRRPKMKFAE